MKYLLLMAALLMVGCGKVSRIEASFTGHSIECVNGVEYIQFISGVTVSYNQDGSIRTCK